MNYIGLLRPNHWIKNLIIFLGIFIALVETNDGLTQGLIFESIILFVAAICISSGNYILNDLTDLRNDLKNPLKKTNLLARKLISKKKAILFMIIFWSVGFVIGILFLNMIILSLLVLLWVFAILYNVKPFRLKDIAFIDVIEESLNNPLRFLIGYFLLMASWPHYLIVVLLLTYSCVLMTGKRFSELKLLGKKAASNYRRVFKFYSSKSLHLALLIYSVISIICLELLALKFNNYFHIIVILFIIHLFWYYRILIRKKEGMPEPVYVYKETLFAVYSLVMLILAFIIIV